MTAITSALLPPDLAQPSSECLLPNVQHLQRSPESRELIKGQEGHVHPLALGPVLLSTGHERHKAGPCLVTVLQGMDVLSWLARMALQLLRSETVLLTLKFKYLNAASVEKPETH